MSTESGKHCFLISRFQGEKKVVAALCRVWCRISSRKKHSRGFAEREREEKLASFFVREYVNILIILYVTQFY